jgi:allophanate hydrolase subunit 2
VLRIVPGPREDWFADPALAALTASEWNVTPASNRVGIRLAGPPLARARTEELLSEGLVTGALQVPPNGQPILLLNDHPTTGGYPVIAVVASDDLPRAGQLRPGDSVRFRL